jgi:hypothetical protein
MHKIMQKGNLKMLIEPVKTLLIITSIIIVSIIVIGTTLWKLK